MIVHAEAGDTKVYRSGLLSIAGSASRSLQLGYDARLDGHAVVRRLAHELPPEAADLIEIAAMAYAADRLAPRPSEREIIGGSGWGRRLWLQVPVRTPVLWNALAGQLTEFLEWLTHDEWALEFCQLAEGAGALDSAQGFLFDTIPGGSSPALFSGGLDSALGLARDLRDLPAIEPIAVSVHTNGRMEAVQRKLVGQLAEASGRCVHLQYRVSLRERDHENSQRTRGLLFLAVGIGTAWGLGQDRLRVYENGIGAINLPYLRSQHGPQATRSMHPRTLWLAERLASALSGRPFRIESPFQLSTKAEAVSTAPEIDARTIGATVSCDTGFAARVHGFSHCGSCTSCLLRRQALIAGGRPDADAATAYRTRTPVGTGAFVAMEWQLDRLRDALNSPDPWRSLVLEFPQVLDVPPVAPSEVVRLYRAYLREWDAVGRDIGLQDYEGSAAL